MSVDSFLDLLAQRLLVSDQALGMLRDRIARANTPVSDAAAAQFLIQEGLLTQPQAIELLGHAPDAEPRGLEALLLGDDSTENSPGQSAAEDEGDFQDDSSIFSPLFKGKQAADSTPAKKPSAEADDEVRLVPIDAPARSASKPKPSLLSGVPPQRAKGPIQDPPISKDNVNVDARGAAVNPSAVESRKGRSGAKREPARSNEDDVSEGSVSALRRLEEKGREKKRRRKNEWDSPLLLAGGGALALLVMCALLVAWMLNWESGDVLLQSARTARDEGSYTVAIDSYQRYLERFQRHSERSLARIELALVRLRQATEGGNFPVALKLAQSELPGIEDEEKFSEAQFELAALLPQIARGLAAQAEAADDPDEAGKSVELANAALILCGNTLYLPKSLRDETELNEIQRTLDLVHRRQESRQELQKTIQAMDAAIAAGDTRASFEQYKQLVDKYPELNAEPDLSEMVVKTSAAERAGIRFVVDKQQSETTESPVPWTAALTIARRRLPGAATGLGAAACVRVDGAVYGLDASTGKVLWRRFVGFDEAAPPLSIGTDVLVIDATEHQLLRLEARTGKLRWRLKFDQPISAPLVVDQRTYVVEKSGRLYVVDTNSGTQEGYLQFAQPLLVAPAVDRTGKWLFVIGEHSSIYTISLPDFACQGVYYLGHSSGSVRVSPAHMRDRLAVLENDGVETCQLHLLALDENRAVSGSVTVRRLTGLAAAPPLVDGRRLAVVTDRGKIEVYELGTGEGDAALIPLATREPTSQEPRVRYVVFAGGFFWVGDTQLTKYGVVPTNNRLPVEDIDENYAGATFDHPFQLIGTTLVHVRRPANRAGAAVAAMNTESGRVLWETDLAVPPATAPIADETTRALTVANANGFVFHVGPEQLRAGVQDEALKASATPARPPLLTGAVDLGSGRAVFTAAPSSNELLLYDSAQRPASLRWIKLPSRLACAVTPFASGFLAPLEIGQVFYLDLDTGQPLAMPFQPRLQARTTLAYQPAAEVSRENRQFVITDGREQIFLVGQFDQPQPRLLAIAEAKVGPYPIISPIVVMGDAAWAVSEGNLLVRYRLPSLENAGETELRAQIVSGPIAFGQQLLLVSADERLIAVGAGGEVDWEVPLEFGDLAGPPLVKDDGIYLAYRRGVLERRSATDGLPQGQIDVRQPLGTGPIVFMDRVVLTAHDGTLLVVDPPQRTRQ
jgi:PQQ-like domain